MKERISSIPQTSGNTVQTDPAALSASELAQLEEMSRGELIAILRASNADRIGYALLTDDERKLSLRIKLMDLALKAPDDKVALNAINQLLDRIEGKPAGSGTQIMLGSKEDMHVKIVFTDSNNRVIEP